MRLTSLFFSLFFIACAGPGAPLVSPVTPAPASAAPGLHLVLSKTSAPLGETIALYLENTGSAPFIQHFPGGTSGCAEASFSFQLQEDSGRLLTNAYPGVDRSCLAVMIPESDVTIAPGKRLQIGSLSTEISFYALPTSIASPVTQIPAEALHAGRYLVRVQTSLGLLTQDITLR